jgi:DnaJ family protein B protein 12
MGGMGGGGPQFVFNMGGGPGFTVHRMGGQTPRRRPANAEEAEPPRGFAALTQFLPLLLLFILPLLSSLFSGSTSGPQMRFDSPIPPHTMHRITPKYNIDYFINPAEVDGFTSRKFSQLDQRAEVDFVQNLRYSCDNEMHTKRTEINEATGFLWTDEPRLRRARNMPMPACQRLEELRISRSSGY